MHKLPRTKRTLEKRAASLRSLLKQNASETKLLKAAEKARVAKVQVLRATIGEMPSPIRTPAQNRRIAKLEVQMDALCALTLPEILAQFRPAHSDSPAR